MNTQTTTQTINVSVIDNDGARIVSVPTGSTVADLSRQLGKEGADRLPVMDENARTLDANTVLHEGMSVAYSFKVAGA